LYDQKSHLTSVFEKGKAIQGQSLASLSKEKSQRTKAALELRKENTTKRMQIHG